MEKKYMRCKVCGQIIEVIKDTGVPLICCGEPMEEIKPQQEESMLGEKHIPTYQIRNNKVMVRVGSVLHPSTNEHYIEWISLLTSKGNHIKMLKPGDAPEAVFNIADDELVTDIYAYCNIHRLWKVCLDKKTKKGCGCYKDFD